MSRRCRGGDAHEVSFFQMPYVQARYAPLRAGTVLFAREGTTKRFTRSLRGHLWYLQLKRLLSERQPGTCCEVRFVKEMSGSGPPRLLLFVFVLPPLIPESSVSPAHVHHIGDVHAFESRAPHERPC